jgi:prolyl-tRNA editing enzyme YbaK/EbsC (Cys-tRNA(Pro) deacylase)
MSETETQKVEASVESAATTAATKVETEAKSTFKTLVAKYGKPAAIVISVVVILAALHFA